MKNWIILAAGILALSATAAQAQAEGEPTEAAAARTIRDGIFDSVNGRGWVGEAVMLQEGDSIWHHAHFNRYEYRRQPDGTFEYVDPKDGYRYVMRIVDPTTIESFSPDHPDNAPVRYVRRNGTGPQATEIKFGYFKYIDPQWADQGLVLSLEGDTIHAATANTVAEYRRQPDGTFLAPPINGAPGYGLRILNKYTVEIFTPSKPELAPSRMIRRGDAPATYIADARRAGELIEQRHREAEAAWYAEQDRLDAEWLEEQAAIEEELAEQSVEPASGPNILQGFMKGLSEATAQNQAMERSMDEAIDRGIADGAAEYARRQAEIAREEAAKRRADAEHARLVRDQEEAERQARLAERRRAEQRLAEQRRAEEYARQQRAQAEAENETRVAAAEPGPAPGSPGSSSSGNRPAGRALQGFWGPSCERALAGATYTTPGSTFEEVEREETSGGCLVRGYLTLPANTGGASRQ